MEITKRIEAAREEGDLKENGGYHAAKEEQGKNEARVRQLKQLLEIRQDRCSRGRRRRGRRGQGRDCSSFVEFDDEETFLLGSREEAAHASDRGLLPYLTPRCCCRRQEGRRNRQL